jgi:hypothetical protein
MPSTKALKKFPDYTQNGEFSIKSDAGGVASRIGRKILFWAAVASCVLLRPRCWRFGMTREKVESSEVRH